MLKPVFGVVVAASMFVASSVAFAQTPMAAPPPGAAPGAAPDAAPMSKKAIRKECAAQAKAQNLKGKAKKTFQNSCFKNGGQAPT